MRFVETPLPGVWVIEADRLEDERGHFARTYCEQAFAERGLVTRWVQGNTSFNRRASTLRGMHYQAAPHGETKLIRCTRGALFDAVVDLRPDSPTRGRWFGVELSAENGRSLYVPEGLAHGFQTLEDATEVFYQMSRVYVPEAARGVRWDDPAFSITWPDATTRVMADRDRAYPDWRP